MKLMTLNTHSLAEADYEEKLRLFVEGVLKERPDVMALQEVNQTMEGEEVSAVTLIASGYYPCPQPGEEASVKERTMPSTGSFPPIRRTNHAFRAAQALSQAGFPCFWTWVPAKVGYGIYDEGTALFSRLPILAAGQFYLTESQDYQDWKTRKALYITVEKEGRPHTFFSLHMGWWQDEKEPFKEQWRRLLKRTEPLRRNGAVWLMGDFNGPDTLRGESYDMVEGDGWKDVYRLAKERAGTITVPGVIDGWRDKQAAAGMRIDYIWYGGPYSEDLDIAVSRAATVFDGERHPVVSDHFGLLAQWEEMRRRVTS